MKRPALLSHVLPRHDESDGRTSVILYDVERQIAHQVALRTWSIIEAMDGTRDLDGLRRYAAARAITLAPGELEAFVDSLEEAGLVGPLPSAGENDQQAAERGVPQASKVDGSGTEARRVSLPNYVFECDGRGSCCRFYPSIAFREEDAVRARAARPEIGDGARHPDRVFLPLQGGARQIHSVKLVNGACIYLEGERGCGVHRAVGGEHKPLGCRTYPSRYVAFEGEVRHLVHLECACVFRSARTRRGDADEGSTSLDVSPDVGIERLPAEVWLHGEHVIPTGEFLAWSERIVRDQAPEEAKKTNAAAWFLGLGMSLEIGTLPPLVERAALDDETRAWIVVGSEALRRRLQALSREGFRSDHDLVVRAALLFDTALELLEVALDPIWNDADTFANDEIFYREVTLFGGLLIHRAGRRSASLLSRDRMLRILIARAFATASALSGVTDPAFEAPLAMVDAMMRGYGLQAYLSDAWSTSPSCVRSAASER